ncbi:MAG: CBS domain-containing protein, partial [Deltaproteobacteria bacterium]|nr:CBS domain-containing protein [Deltaproteobacteria bacterium]
EALFALGRMGDRIFVVARSRVPEVDVAAVLAEMGGGGHAFAASAAMRDVTLPQAEAQLVSILQAKVKPRQKAADIMSTPPITCTTDVTIKEAGRLMTQYGVNALVVTALDNGGGRLEGYISRQVVEKALHHGLSKIPVSEYMTSDPVTVGPHADLAEIQEKIIEYKQRLLPVVEEGHILGVITRTDLLNLLVTDSKRKTLTGAGEGKSHERRVPKLLRDRLPNRIYRLVRELGQTADEMGVPAYLVGGFVRDLFLMEKNEDVDVMVEGDGIAFARAFAKKAGARVHSHARFGTAVVTLPDGAKIDVASARFEYYQSPGSLPVVESGSLKLDLYRRDFTINTMVIRINEDGFGTLIDFFGAKRDLKARVIRVLHNLSFVEDPTRVFRAIRFEQRFGFSIGKLTLSLIENAVRMNFFDRLPGKRIWTELRLILNEENVVPIIRRMGKLGLLKFIDPEIRFDEAKEEVFSAVKKVLDWHDLLFLDDSYNKWAVQFLALIHGLDKAGAQRVCGRLELSEKLRRLFVDERDRAFRRLNRLSGPHLANSEVFRILHPLPVELLLYIMAVARAEEARRRISLFFTQLRGTKVQISGRDLKAMGVPPGPVYKKVLDAVLTARLDERAHTREDELALAARLLAEHGFEAHHTPGGGPCDGGDHP